MKKTNVFISILVSLCFLASTTGMSLTEDTQQESPVPLDYDGYTEITSLKTGWNLISSSVEINKTDVYVEYNDTVYTFEDAVSQSVILSFMFGWDRDNQQYILSEILYPGEGYWMYAYVDCVLTRSPGDTMKLNLIDRKVSQSSLYGYQSVYSDGTYIYVGREGGEVAGGIDIYKLVDNKLQLITSTTINTVFGFWTDGTYLYASCGRPTGICAYRFDGTNLTFISNRWDGTVTDYRGVDGIAGSPTALFVASEDEGIFAYTFDGTAFTLKDNKADGLTDLYFDVSINGSTVYVAGGNDGITAYIWNGATLTWVGNWTNPAGAGTPNCQGICHDGKYIYTSSRLWRMFIYSWNGNFVYIFGEALNVSNLINDICLYNKYICLSDSSGIIYVYNFDGKTHLLVTQIINNSPQAVYSDGAYLYVASRFRLGGENGSIDVYQLDYGRTMTINGEMAFQL